MMYRPDNDRCLAEARGIYLRRTGVEKDAKCIHGRYSNGCGECDYEISKIQLGLLFDQRLALIEAWLECPDAALPIAALWDRRPEGQRW